MRISDWSSDVCSSDLDTFLRLRERVAVARDCNAELFISLHADSHPSSSTRGLSVYTLSSTASDKEAAALAQRENKADLIAGVDLSAESREVVDILIDLAQRETVNLSAHYAGTLVSHPAASSEEHTSELQSLMRIT